MPTEKPITALKMLTLDCADPGTSARLWREVLGWDQPYAHTLVRLSVVAQRYHACGSSGPKALGRPR